MRWRVACPYMRRVSDIIHPPVPQVLSTHAHRSCCHAAVYDCMCVMHTLTSDSPHQERTQPITQVAPR